MNQWIFLRHGESIANQQRVFSGHQDVELTEHGREQAIQAGVQIKQLLRGQVPHTAWSSDLIRARETATLALSAAHFDCTLNIDPALRERNLGDWQGHCIDALKASGERDILLTWKGHAPGGESLADISLRAVQLLKSLPQQGPILIVAHGGLIRALVGLLDGTDREQIGRVNIPNAQPIERWVSDVRWTQIFRELSG